MNLKLQEGSFGNFLHAIDLELKHLNLLSASSLLNIYLAIVKHEFSKNRECEMMPTNILFIDMIMYTITNSPHNIHHFMLNCVQSFPIMHSWVRMFLDKYRAKDVIPIDERKHYLA